MGNNFGAAEDTATQLDIIRSALQPVTNAEEGGVLVDYPTQWTTPFEFAPGETVNAATA